MENNVVGILLGAFATLGIFLLAFLIFIVIINWKLFTKAGKPGWASIIPIYNSIVLLEIIGYKWYYIFVLFASVIPTIGSIIVLLFSITSYIKLAKSYGKETGFGIGLLFLYPIFGAMLAFSKKTKYVGPAVNGDIDFKDLF